ncbi:MAG: MerR family transcriptional regulator, partial [bacterium]|nr:MerR family transcriptional regulator [bacterium]
MDAYRHNVNDIIKRIGRAKTTFLRWEKEGKIPPAHRDDKGWRYYTDQEYQQILKLVSTTDYFRAGAKGLIEPEALRAERPDEGRTEIKSEVPRPRVSLASLDFLPFLPESGADSWDRELFDEEIISPRSAEIQAPKIFPAISRERILFSHFNIFNFFRYNLRHLLIPALAAVLIFSFGLFGDSLASLGRSTLSEVERVGKNLGNIFSSLARHSFSEGGIVSDTLSLLSSRAPSQNLSGSVFSSISSFFSQASNQIASWFSSLQDALLTLLGYPSEEELVVTPSPPLQNFAPQNLGVGAASSTPSGVKELARLQTELDRAKSQGLDVSPAPSPRIIERVIERSIAGLSSQEVDQKLSFLNQALLTEISQVRTALEQKTQANFNALALTQRINNLGAVTITSPTIQTAAITSSTFSGTNVTADGGTFGSLTVTGTQTTSGNQTIGNLLTVSSVNATSTATSTITKLLVTNVPSLPHIFSTWATGVASSSVLDASFVINPASAAADTNLLGIAVNGSPKALIDAEGDLFIRNLVAEGSVTQGATTLASLSVEGNSTFGDAIGDTITYNTGTLTFNNRATTTIPNLTVNAYSIATSTSIVPTFTISTASSPFGLVGIGTTSPTESLSTAGRLYIGGTGTSTFENNLIVRGTLQTGSGSIFLGSNFLNFNTSASTSLPAALNAWNIANSLLSLDTSNFRVGIGTSTPSNSFSLLGNAYISGSLANVSNITATGTIQTTGSATSTWSSAGI